MPRPRRRVNTREQAAEALSRVAPLASRWVERLLATHEPPLTPAQYLALQAVAEADVVGAELARRAAISPAAVSQLLTGLEDAGFLERLPTPDDRRRQTLALTERGKYVLRSVQGLLRERLAGLLASLPPPEAHALTRLLNQVEALLTGTAPPPRPHRPHPPSHRPR
jgi:MarR family transcriptional regulator for hemolysin